MENKIHNITVHFVGNKSIEELLCLSKTNLIIDDDVIVPLEKYFLDSFSTDEYFQLYHDSGLEYNVVYGTTSQIFDNPDCLLEQSVNLAKHLYEHRGPTENVSVSMVPYALDLLIKPFMRLTTEDETSN